MGIPKRYKWVVIRSTSNMATFSTTKPKKVQGGYLFPDGQRIVGTGITLVSRSNYEKEWYGTSTNKGKNWIAFTIALIVAIISALVFKN